MTGTVAHSSDKITRPLTNRHLKLILGKTNHAVLSILRAFLKLARVLHNLHKQQVLLLKANPACFVNLCEALANKCLEAIPALVYQTANKSLFP